MKAFERLPYRPVPDFLGEFSFCTYNSTGALPRVFAPLAQDLATFADHQRFNAAFIQRYQPEDFVLWHRDPRNNIDHTLIAIFGEFTGAISDVDGIHFQLTHGDVLKLPCTINGVQGPPHSVSPVLSGTRYALILNTIERT